jgi:transglutaminase-like putative cysteine protease
MKPKNMTVDNTLRFILVITTSMIITFIFAVVPGCSITTDAPRQSGSFIIADMPYDLTNDITYAGRSYKGFEATTDTGSPETGAMADDQVSITEPAVKGFDADGCFVLKGGTTGTGSEQYVAILVSRQDNSDDSTWYWGRGTDFQKRIWLRFGPGLYIIDVFKTSVSCNLDYDGDIYGWAYSSPGYRFVVNNTRNEDGRFIYPSDPIQSDDPRIESLALELSAGLETTHDKVKAFHDHVVRTKFYDYDSLKPNSRKKQDAVSTLINDSTVCEGYTSLLNALCRSAGIPAKCFAGQMSSGGWHAWSAIHDGCEWKLADATWDELPPYGVQHTSLKWKYFWKDEFPSSHENYGWAEMERPYRGGSHEDIQQFRGYPAGWY